MSNNNTDSILPSRVARREAREVRRTSRQPEHDVTTTATRRRPPDLSPEDRKRLERKPAIGLEDAWRPQSIATLVDLGLVEDAAVAAIDARAAEVRAEFLRLGQEALSRASDRVELSALISEATRSMRRFLKKEFIDVQA